MSTVRKVAGHRETENRFFFFPLFARSLAPKLLTFFEFLAPICLDFEWAAFFRKLRAWKNNWELGRKPVWKVICSLELTKYIFHWL